MMFDDSKLNISLLHAARGRPAMLDQTLPSKRDALQPCEGPSVAWKSRCQPVAGIAVTSEV